MTTASDAATAVDLSRLPSPNVVEQLSFEDIREQMLAKLVEFDTSLTGLVPADPAYKVLEVAAYRELMIRQRINEAGKAVMLAYAIDGDLDHLAALVGVERLVLDPGDPDAGINPTYEENDDLRRRVVLAPDGFSVAGPEGAYVFHALSADGGVLDASCISPAPAEILITVLARAGDGTADGDLLAAVATRLSAENTRPLTDEVTVQSAEIVTFEVEAEIWTYAGPDSSVVLAEGERRLTKYLADCHRLGRDVVRSGIHAALHVDGVQKVNLIQPAADIVVDRTQATWCTGRTIISAGVGE